MSYKLKFHEEAKKEWNKLDWTIQKQFLPILERRLQNPRVQSAKLRDAPDCYKIKLGAVGYRMVYQVIDSEIVVLILAVGKREGGVAYRKMKQRQ